MSAIPHQDHIVLGGLPSPGLAVVRGAGQPRSWDIQQGYGLTGATIIFKGCGLSKFYVDIFAWTEAHFTAWDVWAKAVLMPPAPVRNPASLSIQHPVLNSPPLSITQVVVGDPGQWEQNDEGGLWVRTLDLLEYRKPRPVLVKPFEGPPGSPVNVPPPVDPELLQIQTNAAQIAKLAGGG